MPHQRQLIRQAVKAQLLGATAAEDRVYTNRMFPYTRAQLPALAVYTLEEEVEPFNTAPRELKRTLQLAIEAAVEETEEVDDALDVLALQVEAAMDLDETLGGTASDSLLSSTQMEVIETGSRSAGVIRLEYTVTYYTHVPQVREGLDDFVTADVRHSLANAVHPDDQGHDIVELPQEE